MKFVDQMRSQLILLLLFSPSTILASPGDNLDEFIDCTYACEFQRSCPHSEIAYIDSTTNEFSKYNFEETPRLLTQFLFWDCISDCDYQCQQIITKLRIADDEEIYQFHGKWPFIRLLGCQEIFSTLFSIANFIPHYWGYQKLTEKIQRVQYRGDRRRVNLLQNYTYVAISGMLAWTASSAFHMRDLLITEKLDYFFAGGTVLSGFHAIFSRITRLDQRPHLAKVLSWSVILIFALHILRLYIDWSYTYNMRFNICFGLLQYILLLLLAYQNYKSLKTQKKTQISPYNMPSKRVFKLCIIPIVLVVSTALAMCLEVFDFFSYTWQIDAHALWHLCTILPSWFLYDFFLTDFNFVTKEYFE